LSQYGSPGLQRRMHVNKLVVVLESLRGSHGHLDAFP